MTHGLFATQELEVSAAHGAVPREEAEAAIRGFIAGQARVLLGSRGVVYPLTKSKQLNVFNATRHLVS